MLWSLEDLEGIGKVVAHFFNTCVLHLLFLANNNSSKY